MADAGFATGVIVGRGCRSRLPGRSMAGPGRRTYGERDITLTPRGLAEERALTLEVRWPSRSNSRSTAAPTTARRYVSWAPSPATLRIADPSGAVDPLPVRLLSRALPAAGSSSRRPQRPGRRRDRAHPADRRLTRAVLGAGPVRRTQPGGPGRGDPGAADHRPTPLATFPLMVRIRKDAETLTDRRTRPVPVRIGPVEQRRHRHLPRLSRHAHRRDQPAGARPGRVPALAPGLPARPRTRTAADRPVRRAAVLAVRPAVTEAVHASLTSADSTRRPAPCGSRRPTR